MARRRKQIPKVFFPLAYLCVPYTQTYAYTQKGKGTG